MRLPASPPLKDNDPQFERMAGPTVAPGQYQVSLQVGEDMQTQSFGLVKEANSSASEADLQEQFSLLKRIYDTYSQATESLNLMRSYRRQLDSLAERLAESADCADLADRAMTIKEGILEIEKRILIPDLPSGWAGRLNQGTDPLRRLSALPSVVGLGEFPPTDAAYAVYDKLSGLIQGQIRAFHALVESELSGFNHQLAARGIAVIG